MLEKSDALLLCIGKKGLNMKKFLVAVCSMILVLSLVGCGEPEKKIIIVDGVWEDGSGNMIQFMPEESAYILKTANGRVGRSSYNTESGMFFFNGFLYDVEETDDGGIKVISNGYSIYEEESLDGFIFWPSDKTEIPENDLSYLDGTWSNEYGTTITIKTESMEYDIDTESMCGTGTLSDEGDGRGLHLYSDGFVFIEYNDDGSLSFESDNSAFDGIFSAVY